MPKVQFKYDISEDTKNWIRFMYGPAPAFGLDKNHILKPIPPAIIQQIKRLSQQRMFKLVKQYLKHHVSKDFVDLYLNYIRDAWNEVNDDYFKAVQKVTGKPVFSKTFHCFLTTLGICPYFTKTRMFMTSLLMPIQRSVTTAAHELLHMQFEHYFYDYCRKKLNTQQFQHLKESLTFLLNEKEFSRIISVVDKGYPYHHELRKKLSEYWKRHRNFKKLVDYGISITPMMTDQYIYLSFGKYTSNCPQKLLKKVQRIKQTRIDKKYIYTILRIIKHEFNRKKYKTTTTNIFSKSRFISAKDVLRKRQATCGSMATVVASVLRTLGIPTKLVNGYLDKKGEHHRHAWNEIYIPSLKKFIPFDITRKNLRVGKRHIRKDEWVDWGEMEKKYNFKDY